MENTSSGSELVARLRREYSSTGFDVADLAGTWHEQFDRWMTAAVGAGLYEPHAMVLSTADGEGRPSSRHVLLRGYGPEGFVFFTSYRSRKGSEIAVNPWVSLLFAWLPLHRQVVVTGKAEKVSRDETVEYFTSRPRGSQLASFISPQSAVIPDRRTLDLAWERAEAAHPDEVPVPEDWGGYRVRSDSVEFWQGREKRMHDRLRYGRVASGAWVVERLAP